MPKEPSVKRGRKTDAPQAPLVPPPEPPRNYGPRGIAALLAPITRPAFKKRAPAAAQLFADWPQLAGPELCARASPVKFAGGTLTLGCSGPTAMELQFVEAQIIERLNMGLGQGTVERLRFVQASPRLPAPPAPRPRPPNIAPPPGLPEGELGEALAKLYLGLKTRG
ncbi:DUF721 domain-containing protein [Acidocella sp.]|uniref:DUF721 domain-containing protein n=1 Tax=Acidocella sp. TaxID=50710 RepID=UPI002629CF7D|nr:DUF721 domain-containing protein [Acidocella sp.]